MTNELPQETCRIFMTVASLIPDVTQYKLYGIRYTPSTPLEVAFDVPMQYVYRNDENSTVLTVEGMRFVMNVLASQTELANGERRFFVNPNL